MSQFNLENEICSLVRMDAPLTKGPQMRWQRKLDGNKSMNESAANCSLNMSTSTKTPMKLVNRSLSSTNSNSRTPGTGSFSTKTPSKNKTPGHGSKTPTSKTPGGDRFIPSRSSTQFELGHYLLNNPKPEDANDLLSPSEKEFRKVMSDNLNGADSMSSKIIGYKNKPPAAPEGYQNHLKVLYSSSKSAPGTLRKTNRHIPQMPERILDAPEILDDYYLNLLDWSANNHLAVCLGGHVYLWNAESGEIHQLMEMESTEEYVSSVSWIKEGNILAVGTSTAEVQLWDVEHQKKIRNMGGHSARIGALSWNNYVLSSGSRSGNIHHHDVRVSNHHVGTLQGHTQEVCGLKWSPDGRYLASGGNDNLLNIWPAIPGNCNTETSPVFTFSHHQAAVKALAWCPWQPSLLASGGGTNDRHIRFWNVNTGSCVQSVDTQSQVCALLWSKEYKELISSHGFAHYQLIIWKYPSMTKVAEMTGHTARVLHMAMAPDGQTVVSAAADETLRLWKCFQKDPAKKKKVPTATLR